MKYILIFLLSFPVMAEVKVQRLSDGYLLVFNDGCWNIPQYVNINYFPLELTPVSDVAKDWDFSTAEEVITKCAKALQSYTVQPWRTGDTMRNVYDVPQGKVVGQVPVGSKCGEIVAPYRDWKDWGYGRVETTDNKIGVTVCKRQD